MQGGHFLQRFNSGQDRKDTVSTKDKRNLLIVCLYLLKYKWEMLTSDKYKALNN